MQITEGEHRTLQIRLVKIRSAEIGLHKFRSFQVSLPKDRTGEIDLRKVRKGEPLADQDSLLLSLRQDHCEFLFHEALSFLRRSHDLPDSSRQRPHPLCQPLQTRAVARIEECLCGPLHVLEKDTLLTQKPDKLLSFSAHLLAHDLLYPRLSWVWLRSSGEALPQLRANRFV